ncbi:MAG: hypothetical protein QXE13_06360 [Sulfolobales archaeon]
MRRSREDSRGGENKNFSLEESRRDYLKRARQNNAVTESIAMIILFLIVLSIMIPVLLLYMQRGSTTTGSVDLYLEEMYRRDLEMADVYVSMRKGEISGYYLNNTGSVELYLTTAWIYINNTFKPFTVGIKLMPGDSLDLGVLARNISDYTGVSISPLDIYALVTSRGKIIPIAQRIYDYIFSKPVAIIGYGESVIRIMPSNDNTLLDKNFTNLINQGRIETLYSSTVSAPPSGTQCNKKANPYVGYISNYSNPLLLLKDRDLVILSLANKQSGCILISLYNISRVINPQDVFLLLKLVIVANLTRDRGDPGITYVNVSVGFYNRSVSQFYSNATASTAINMSSPNMIYPWQVFLKLDHRFLTVDLMREYLSLDIYILLYREGANEYNYIVGVEYIIFQGMIVYG